LNELAAVVGFGKGQAGSGKFTSTRKDVLVMFSVLHCLNLCGNTYNIVW
jgi:hypothetical protein